MADGTKIQWTDATWNPTRGCTRVSPGCGGPGDNGGCYAERDAARFSGIDPNTGKPQWGHGFAEMRGGKPRWTGKVELIEHMLTVPLRWKAPRKIFVNSTSDLFHEELSDEAIDRVVAVMALAPQHTFQVLTKRAERMQAYVDDDDRHYKVAAALGNMLDGDWIWNKGKQYRKRIETMISALHGIEYVGEEELPDGSHTLGDEQQINPPWPLPNVWLGVSAERQQEADERREPLRALAEQRWLTFVSYEPALGAVDWAGWEFLRWLISGGESGTNARPSHPDWHRAARDWCEANDVEYFFKQWGHFIPESCAARDHQGAHTSQTLGKSCVKQAGEIFWSVGKKAAGRLLDGIEHNGMPHTPTTEPSIHPRPAGGNTDYLAHHPRDG